ncbi:hypothetical protein SAMD00019534_079890, partial [Acytostelium subglobosum LB1]|uniref:hypothetical protein n=1 Tax=Acytostelium subglobosum LB1 TaxID=1410327 RepID=UPI000644A086
MDLDHNINTAVADHHDLQFDDDDEEYDDDDEYLDEEYDDNGSGHHNVQTLYTNSTNDHQVTMMVPFDDDNAAVPMIDYNYTLIETPDFAKHYSRGSSNNTTSGTAANYIDLNSRHNLANTSLAGGRDATPAAQDDPPLVLHFCKMHGCGNDFVIFHIDSLRNEITGQNVVPSLAELQLIARYLCDRTTGVGANHMLVVTPPPSNVTAAQYQMLIFNADGSMAEICGNGIRCLTKFIIDYQVRPYNNAGSSSHIVENHHYNSPPSSGAPASPLTGGASNGQAHLQQHLVPFFTKTDQQPRLQTQSPYNQFNPICLTVKTVAGVLQCCPLPSHPQNNSRTLWVKVCMGKPQMVTTVDPISIPGLEPNVDNQTTTDNKQQQQQQQCSRLLSTRSNREDYCKLIPFKGHSINSTLVSMGNPHCVVHLENVEDFPMNFYGQLIESHPIFPDKTNVEFVEVLAPNQVRAR